MKKRIMAAPHRTRSASLLLWGGGCLALSLWLNVGCGARTGFGSDPSWFDVPGAGGAACTKDWDQIIWDDSLEEAAVYLWTESPKSTWAVVSSNLVGQQSFFRDHWDGTQWTRTTNASNASKFFEDQQIWAMDGLHAFAGASTHVQIWSGTSWADLKDAPGCRAIAGTDNNDLWCAADHELWRFNAGKWTALAMSDIQGIFADARDDVWVWGTRGASHFDGKQWTLELSDPIKRMSASGPHDVWAVQDGNLLHSTGPGTTWTRQNPTGGQIASVWSQAPNNTWIVAAGAAMRWNGTSWVLIDLPMQDERLLISGSSEDIWIAGTLKLAHGRPLCR